MGRGRNRGQAGGCDEARGRRRRERRQHRAAARRRRRRGVRDGRGRVPARRGRAAHGRRGSRALRADGRAGRVRRPRRRGRARLPRGGRGGVIARRFLEAPVLVATDSFKGTLSAERVAAAVARGLRDGGRRAVELPVADGGEGTMEVLLRTLGGERRRVTVSDPLGRPVRASYGLVDGGETAIVEMAQASGLGLVAEGERDAWAASTRGTGELIVAAVEAGARTVVVAVGGSATTDGGADAVEAIQGARSELVARSRVGFVSRRAGKAAKEVALVVACDVRTSWEDAP